jgi:AAA domain, putative AbiEii toxin, Type IV TA system/AAA ATPase domain
MRILSTVIDNYRGLEHVELTFEPGFNLIVGVNGVGKTSVLTALAASCGAVLGSAYGKRSAGPKVTLQTIRSGSHWSDVRTTFALGSGVVSHRFFVTDDHDPERVRVPRTPKSVVAPRWLEVDQHDPTGVPFVLYFGTRRALASDRKPSADSSRGGIAAALALALADRELRLQEIVEWMRAQEELGKDDHKRADMLRSLHRTVERFLPHYSNLRIDTEARLAIDRGGLTIPVQFLSDGERSSLAMVLDLSRRLSIANPHLEEPSLEAEAVVLIDEIDLHLHPLWQRTIVGLLTASFPKCQFIATTHSPQIIGEVAHDRIQILDPEARPTGVYKPPHSLGVDSSRVLREVMDTPGRNAESEKLFGSVTEAIDGEDFSRARSVLHQLEDIVGNDDPDVLHYVTLIDMLDDNSPADPNATNN